MRKNTCFSALVTSLFVVLTATTVDAREPRTYRGGRGYGYRQPNVEARLLQWHDARLLSTGRSRRYYAPIASPFAFGGWSSGEVREVYSVKVGSSFSQRDAIKLAQRSLRGLGYYRGADDGIMSRSFEQALRRFQAESGARNTGVVDAETLHTLGFRPATAAR